MKRYTLTIIALLTATALMAQKDSTAFRAYLYNKEYQVFMRINFHQQDIIIPGQDILGPVAGYLGKERYTFCWPVISAEVKGNKARLVMVNDYGSEDLEAVLIRENDSIYTLHQGNGSTIKMPDGGKWQKLPRTLTMKREDK
ncbi:MAG: hypothetical protein IJ544_04955 [Prevotella sp.]|nr:hypothetical protein [Prevotella sp.]